MEKKNRIGFSQQKFFDRLFFKKVGMKGKGESEGSPSGVQICGFSLASLQLQWFPFGCGRRPRCALRVKDSFRFLPNEI